MEIQEIRHNITDNGSQTQNDSCNGELLPNSSAITNNRGVENSQSGLNVMKNTVSQTQKIASEEGTVERRASPRLKSIPESKRPCYGTARRDTPQHLKENCKQEIIDVNHLAHKSSPNTSVNKGACTESATKTGYVTPKLSDSNLEPESMEIQEIRHNITDNGSQPQNDSCYGELSLNSSAITNNQGVENSPLGLNVMKNIVSQTQKIASEEGSIERRASPRLKSIPESKRPSYGTARRDTPQHLKENCKQETSDVNHLAHKSSPNTSVKKDAYTESATKTDYVTPKLSDFNFETESMGIQEVRHNITANGSQSRNDSCNGELPLNSSAITNHQGVENSPLGLNVMKNIVSQAQKIASEEGSTERRSSPRLKSIPESKRPHYGTARRYTPQHLEDNCKQEIIDVNNLAHKSSPNTSVKKDSDTESATKTDYMTPNVWKNGFSVKFNGEVAGSDFARPITCSSSDSDCRNDSEADTLRWLGPCSSLSDTDAKSAIASVKETLKIYNSYYLHFVQEKQKKKEVEGQKAVAGSKRKKGDLLDKDVNVSAERPDLKALTKMLENKKILCPEKRIGTFPGIDVGYRFFSRAEMVALGFHSHWMKGIDFIPKLTRKSMSSLKEYEGYTFPLAVTIVLSGQYEDDVDNLDDIVYTGQGGNDISGKKGQVKDQTLSSGNLALKNNMDQSVPVRVVRGHESKKNKLGKTYTYDGLYKVVNCSPEKGSSGFVVYKYRLRRLEGQPKLTTDQVHFSGSRGSKASRQMTGLVSNDISGGQEELCIPATNVIDDPPVPPTGFTYSKSIQVAENINLPPNAQGCKCKGKCTNPRACSCARLNGCDFPYVKSNGGRLFEAKDVVYECGPNCGCGPDCINRVSQRGIKYQLEVFRTPEKGWAVRSRDSIPSGAPVCEYIGVLRKSDELDNVSGNDYIFEIDCLHTVKEIGGRERRLGNASLQFSDQVEKIDEKTLDNTPEFSIDAGSVGNIARFINHSCEPNLFVQCVLSTHHDLRLARVVLFAAENISPSEELTYDYGYALDSVVGSDGKIKQQPCHCGTDDCRKRLY